MKSFKFILIACFSLMVATTSCKKEKTPEPAPTAQTTTPTTYGTFHIALRWLTEQILQWLQQHGELFEQRTSFATEIELIA